MQGVVQQGRLQMRGGAVGEVRLPRCPMGYMDRHLLSTGTWGEEARTYMGDVRPARGLDGASYLPPDGELRWRWWQCAGGR